MSSIASNILKLKNELPPSVKLIAVSKTKTVTEILEAYNAGQKYFGENKVQELLVKKDVLPTDIEWHFMGHLQTNKVKLIVPFINMIQSVDTLKLLITINNEAVRTDRIVNCLLQLHIAEEKTKFGFRIEELTTMLSSGATSNMHSVNICGLMGMASFTDNTGQVRKEFAYLKQCFDKLKHDYFCTNPHFKEISMGMSGDYETAIEVGSTMVRIGGKLFGERKK